MMPAHDPAGCDRAVAGPAAYGETVYEPALRCGKVSGGDSNGQALRAGHVLPAQPVQGRAEAPAVQVGALHGFDFRLPPELEAAEPPEARGLARDQVRLMVSYRATDHVAHLKFRDLPCVLDPGDVLVINTSGTRIAALSGTLPDGEPVELHLSTRLPGGLWSVELRKPGARGTTPYEGATAGLTVSLPAGASATLLAPYVRPDGETAPRRKRLWLGALETKAAGRPISSYLERYGFPIRYGYVRQAWPSEYYQTVYATEPGSAEMPSAGRPFTADLLARLVAAGIWIAPLLLHTGVASLENDEAPYEEFYRIPPATAHLINAAHVHSKRVIAVGTTAVRAVETTADEEGTVHPGEGWTGLVVTPGYRLRAVDALLTGLHEPRSTHLAMLQALAGREHLRLAYSEALQERYLWHEFGDLHLIL